MGLWSDGFLSDILNLNYLLEIKVEISRGLQKYRFEPQEREF